MGHGWPSKPVPFSSVSLSHSAGSKVWVVPSRVMTCIGILSQFPYLFIVGMRHQLPEDLFSPSSRVWVQMSLPQEYVNGLLWLLTGGFIPRSEISTV